MTEYTDNQLRPFDITIQDPLERINSYIQRYKDDSTYDGFEALLMGNIKAVSAKRIEGTQDGVAASAIFELKVVSGLCNPMGRMHGGAVATLADMATTMTTAPVSSKRFWEFGGVSRTLQVTYLNAMPRESIIVVECELRSIGKRLSATQCRMRDKSSGKLLALAEHGKVSLGSQDGISNL